MSQCMHSIDEASHLDVSGVLLHVCETCLTKCVQHVSPRMGPEVCGLTHMRLGGESLLAGVFYIYSAPLLIFIDPKTHKDVG